MKLLFVFALQFLMKSVFAMPYTVPLQGQVGGKETLVILDNLVFFFSIIKFHFGVNKIYFQEDTTLYSNFFEILTTRGHTLTIVNSESPDLKIKSFGEYLFNNVIFFAPTAERLGGISFDDLVDFTNERGNLILALNRDVSDSVRDFVEILGFSIHKKGTEVIDHFEFDSGSDTRFFCHIDDLSC